MPKIVLTPIKGIAGSTVYLSGFQFLAGQVLDVVCGQNLLVHVRADGTGSFAKTIKIPANCSVGNININAKTLKGVIASAPFSVVKPKQKKEGITSSSSGDLLTP